MGIELQDFVHREGGQVARFSTYLSAEKPWPTPPKVLHEEEVCNSS